MYLSLLHIAWYTVYTDLKKYMSITLLDTLVGMTGQVPDIWKIRPCAERSVVCGEMRAMRSYRSRGCCKWVLKVKQDNHWKNLQGAMKMAVSTTEVKYSTGEEKNN